MDAGRRPRGRMLLPQTVQITPVTNGRHVETADTRTVLVADRLSTRVKGRYSPRQALPTGEWGPHIGGYASWRFRARRGWLRPRSTAVQPIAARRPRRCHEARSARARAGGEPA